MLVIAVFSTICVCGQSIISVTLSYARGERSWNHVIHWGCVWNCLAHWLSGGSWKLQHILTPFFAPAKKITTPLLRIYSSSILDLPVQYPRRSTNWYINHESNHVVLVQITQSGWTITPMQMPLLLLLLLLLLWWLLLLLLLLYHYYCYTSSTSATTAATTSITSNSSSTVIFPVLVLLQVIVLQVLVSLLVLPLILLYYN